jgi:hypothetical protein
MANTPDEQHEKEGVSMADIVKALVLAWSAALLTVSYLGIFPQMKMDNTFVASLLTGAMASFGIERKTNGNGNKKPTIVDSKDTKAGIK